MKKRQRKVIISVLIILSLIIFLFQIRKKPKETFQDELIFFKLFSSGEEQNTNILKSKTQTNLASYEFKVSYKNIDFKQINLTDTIHPNTLIREKIAPGTKGKFEIILQSNQKINYRINFKSENEKPENLNFQIEGKERKYTRLEDMEPELMGEMLSNKRIIIHWEWEYQKDNTQDRQDTKDGERIKQYHFTIYAIGE